MTSRLVAGDIEEQAVAVACGTLTFPVLTGTFVTAVGYVPIGFARNSARG